MGPSVTPTVMDPVSDESDSSGAGCTAPVVPDPPDPPPHDETDSVSKAMKNKERRRYATTSPLPADGKNESRIGLPNMLRPAGNPVLTQISFVRLEYVRDWRRFASTNAP